MNKDSLEHLSCLMDGEIQRDTSKFLVRRLGTDQEMRSTWDRYHLIRDCLRHAEGDVAHASLTRRISVAIADEALDTTAVASGRLSGWRWSKPVAGAAIAATVALMAVYSIAPVNQDPGQGPGVEPAASMAAETVQPFSSPNMVVSGPLTSPVNLSGLDDQPSHRKMNSYLLRHYQVAGTKNGKGFVSFVPIVIARPAGQKNQFGSDLTNASGAELTAANRSGRTSEPAASGQSTDQGDKAVPRR